MFSIAFSSLFGQDAARGISGEPYLRAISTRYPPFPTQCAVMAAPRTPPWSNEWPKVPTLLLSCRS
jgi:hypothetical protein